MASYASFIITDLLWSAPQLIVIVGGAIVASRWLNRAPRAAKLVMLGLALMLVERLTMVGLNAYGRTDRDPAYLVLAVTTYGLFVLHSIGSALLMAAAFVGRSGVAGGKGFEVQPVSAAAATPPYGR